MYKDNFAFIFLCRIRRENIQKKHRCHLHWYRSLEQVMWADGGGREGGEEEQQHSSQGELCYLSDVTEREETNHRYVCGVLQN